MANTTDNPYLGQQTYLELYGRYVSAARQWRRVAFLTIFLSALSLGGLILVANQAQVVPYVVKVDRLGTAVAVERADRADKAEKPVIVAQLARWITAVRSVWVDAGAQRGLVKDAYAMINAHAPAYASLNDYMRERDPFVRAKDETVSVDVLSVLPISGDSWRIEWREESRARNGERNTVREYQATVNLSFNPPRDEATIRVNPMGIYINTLEWTERLNKAR